MEEQLPAQTLLHQLQALHPGMNPHQIMHLMRLATSAGSDSDADDEVQIIRVQSFSTGPASPPGLWPCHRREQSAA